MTGVQTCALPIYTLSLHDALPISFNIELHQWILKKLQIEKAIVYNNEVSKIQVEKTYEPITYLQVFSDRFEFQPNLSIIDALFNLGGKGLFKLLSR